MGWFGSQTFALNLSPDTIMKPPSFLKRRHWIFDMDGTLTVPVHDFVSIKATLGLPIDKGILESIAALPEAKAVGVKEQLDEIEVALAKQSKPAVGVCAFLAFLQQRECRLGVLTRNSRSNALISLQALGVLSCFELPCILGRDEALFKPHPEGVLKLLKHWNTQATEAIVVGDYLHDLQAGRTAGTATVHIDRTASFPWPQWMDLGVRTLQELHGQVEHCETLD